MIVSSKALKIWGVLIAIGSILLVYGGVADHEFFMDDNTNVVVNPYLQPVSLKSFHRFWVAPADGLYIPVTYSFWAFVSNISHALTGDLSPNARVFHMTNVMVHIGNFLLVVFILYLVLKDFWGAFCGGLIFAFHPAQVQSVAWVTGLKDVLSTFFALLAIASYLRFRTRTATCAFFTILAFLSKPSTIVLPVLYVLFDYCFDKKSASGCLKTLFRWGILVVPIFVVTISLQVSTSQAPVVDWWQRPLIAADALLFYGRAILFPFYQAIDYVRTPHIVLEKWHSYIQWVVLVSFLWFAYLKKEKQPILLFSTLFFVVALLPVLGFVPFMYQSYSTVADRYLYLAMLAPSLCVGWCMRKRAMKWLMIPVVGVLILLTQSELGLWANHKDLYERTLDFHPTSKMALHNLGLIYGREKQFKKAADLLERCLEIDPDSADLLSDLGTTHAHLGEIVSAKKYFIRALTLEPSHRIAAAGLNHVRLRLGG